MTLDQTLQQCARNTYNQKVMVRSGSGYTGKGLEYAERFVDFINEVLQMIARERWAPTTTQTVALDDLGRFNTSVLTNTLIRIRSVTYENWEYGFDIDAVGRVTVQGGIRDVSVEVMYDYLPARVSLAGLDTDLPYPENVVPPGVIYNYASFMFLYQEGTDYDTTRATPFLNAFNDAYMKILPTDFQRRIK